MRYEIVKANCVWQTRLRLFYIKKLYLKKGNWYDIIILTNKKWYYLNV